jgi:hypothetical protein
MKKVFTLGTLFLGCCLAAVAQTGSTPNQTPSTLPQGQTMARVYGLKAIASEPSNTQVADLEGCMSQSSDGTFMLVDKFGNGYLLHGDRSKFNSYLGKQVRVDGIAGSSADATPFDVSDIHKVSDTCMIGTSK